MSVRILEIVQSFNILKLKNILSRNITWKKRLKPSWDKKLKTNILQEKRFYYFVNYLYSLDWAVSFKLNNLVVFLEHKLFSNLSSSITSTIAFQGK